MDKFEIILIAGISISIILFILMIVSLIQFILAKKEIKKLIANKPKNKKKRRRWKQNVLKLENNKSKKLKYMLFSLLGTIVIGGASGYAKYYQSTTISGQDIDNIVYGYYLLENVEEQINKIDKNNDKKGSDNLHTLGISLSSFASKKGSEKGVEEAQVLLNQYYSRVGQFGVNLSSQNFEELKKSKEKQSEYLEDIKRVKITQKKVIDYYKIDESSLKEKK